MNRFDLSAELSNVGRSIIDYLPRVIGALVILIIGYFVALILAAVARRLLRALRFDRAIHASPAGNIVTRVIESPAKFVGQVVFWLVMIGVISLAIAALNLPLLNNLLDGIYSYIPNVIAAVLIFIVAGIVSTAAVGLVGRLMGRTALAKLISASVPAIVMSLAVFMILNQLGIARDIVNILFTAIVGSAALGMALAFGLGGRDVARGLLEQAAEGAKSHSSDVRQEVSAAAERARR
jgi:small-conductance mechanosensitive channel